MSNPWDVLPRAQVGDPEPDSLYRQVGRATTVWELMDGFLAIIFATLTNSRSGAAEAAYGTIITFTGRTDMILAAADRVFAGRDNDMLAELETLMEELGKMSGRRNEIVHSAVTHFMHNGVSQGHYLVPAIYNQRKRHTQAKMRARWTKFTSVEEILAESAFGDLKYAYVADQVATYVDHFLAYKKRVTDLIPKVSERCRELYPSHDTQRPPETPPTYVVPDSEG